MEPRIQHIITSYENAVGKVVLYCVGEAPFPLGIGRTIGVLKGAKSTFLIEHGFHELATYGIFAVLTRSYLRAVIDVLVERGLLAIENVPQREDMPLVTLTDEGRGFLRSDAVLPLPFANDMADREVVRLTEEQQGLFEALRKARMRIAVAKGYPRTRFATILS